VNDKGRYRQHPLLFLFYQTKKYAIVQQMTAGNHYGTGQSRGIRARDPHAAVIAPMAASSGEFLAWYRDCKLELHNITPGQDAPKPAARPSRISVILIVLR
jgi:hypothetical protein